MSLDPTPTVYLMYRRVLSLDGKSRTVGGVQSYLIALSEAIAGLGWTPVIVQSGDHDFVESINGTKVLGFRLRPKEASSDRYRAFLNRIGSEFDAQRDIVVFAQMALAIPTPGLTSIAIQHGISFDLIMQSERNSRLVGLGLGRCLKWIQRYKELRSFRRCQNVVCVDYNFQNWYRTFSLRDDDDSISVVPSFSVIPDWPIETKPEFKKILFARRFSFERGTPMMVEAADLLMAQNPSLEFTFAGEGPFQHQIEALGRKYPGRVVLTMYRAEESQVFHRKFDIAVVPTLGSEGTSLSLLEAMASGCAVVCSDVGGMTQIVIDKYNGLMIRPNSQNICGAIESLIESPAFANRMRFAARETVAQGFSKRLWTERWQSVLRRVDRNRTED